MAAAPSEDLPVYDDALDDARPPRHPFWRPAILVLGILISAAVAGVVHDMLGREAAAQREVARQSLTAGLQSHVERELGFLRFLRGLYDSSDFVNPQEFQRFARLDPYLCDGQWWISIAWAPRHADLVPVAPSSGSVSKNGTPDSGDAFARSDFFPLTYREPAPDSNQVGRDAAADPLDRAVMLHAARAGGLVVSPPRLMTVGKRRSMGVRVFMPVFTRGQNAVPGTLEGFLVGTIMLDGFFNAFLTDAVGAPSMSVRILDGQTLVFANGHPGNSVTSTALQFGDREFQLEIDGRAPAIAPDFWLPALVFVTGLALTALLYLRLLRADTEYLRIAEEVNLATAELADANHRLAERSIALQQVAEDLRRSSQEAQLANAAKTVFLANMSHELRTPLNAVIGFSEMIANRSLGEDSARYFDYAKDICASGRHLLSIIEDLLDMSRIELGQTQLQAEPTSLGALAADAHRLVADRARDRRIEVRQVGLESMPQVVVDPRAMRQALINLLANAVKFSEPGSTVEIRGEVEAGGGIALSVADHGPGIRPEDLARVFEPFWQGEAYRIKTKDGIGLGLTIAQRLVQAHDGTIEVTSTQGLGTTAIVHLPAARVVRGPVAA